MKCQLTQHKSVGFGYRVRLRLESDSTETSRASGGGGSPFWGNHCVGPQMIYNICHETKLNFAFALTPFMEGAGWFHTHRQNRLSQSTIHDSAAVVSAYSSRGREGDKELTSTGCKSTPYMSCHLTLSK